MPQAERFEVLVLGSGTGGKLVAWHMARSGRRTAVMERRWIGGSCPNVACMPSKNEIRSAEIAHLVRHAAEFGVMAGPIAIDMAAVRRRKREMVDDQIAAHLQNYKASGAELIMGSARFAAPKTLEVSLNDGRHAPAGRRPSLPQSRDARGNSAGWRPRGCAAAHPCRSAGARLCAVTSDRDRRRLCRPRIGTGLRRFGSDVTIIESGPQLMSREDSDVSQEMRRIFVDEGIQVHLAAEILQVSGRSGTKVSLVVRTAAGEQTIEGSDILVAAGRIAPVRACSLVSSLLLNGATMSQQSSLTQPAYSVR